MMQRAIGTIGSAACAVAAMLLGAAAPDGPRLFPDRDAAVSYQATVNGQVAPDAVSVTISAASHVVRLTSPRMQGYVLIDPVAGRLTVVDPAHRTYEDLPLGDDTERFMLLNARMRFARREAGQVAGQDCTNWTVQSSRGTGTACVTSDGVVLRASGNLGGSPENAIEATAVSYQAQPVALFTVPFGYRKLPPPTGPGRPSR